MRLRLLCAGVVGMLWSILTLNCAAAQGAAPARGAPPGGTAFVDVAVIPMDTERVLTGQTVLVEGGRITALGPVGKVQVPSGALRIDGQGKFLIPGLADMHAHIQNQLAGRIDQRAAESYFFQWLSRGFTTLRSPSAHNSISTLLPIRAQVANGTILGPRFYASSSWYPGQDGKPNATAPETITPLITAYKAAGHDFVKPYYESSAVFDSVATAARRVGIPLAGHIPPGVTLTQAFAAPMKSIEHLTGYIAYSGFLDGIDGAKVWTSLSTDTSMLSALAIVRLSKGAHPWHFRDTSSAHLRAVAVATARAGIWNCPTQAVYEEILAPVSGNPGASVDGINLRRRLIKALQDAGAGLLLGSDQGLQGPEYELSALVRAGLTPYQALVTGTRNVAAYFGTLDSTGTIAVGKRADLVLLTGNPLVNVQHVVQPAGVMVGGRWLSRAMLDRRLALEPYEDYARRTGGAMGSLTYVLRLNEQQNPGLIAERKARDQQLAAAYQTAWIALLDTLPSLADSTAVQQRVLGLATRQLGELRAVLTPEQQAVFDPEARTWLQQYTQQGYRVTIPGLPQ